MGFFDEPIRAQAADAGRGILHLLLNHYPSDEIPADLVELADRYLRLNPDDAEVRSALDRLTASARNA